MKCCPFVVFSVTILEEHKIFVIPCDWSIGDLYSLAGP